jgi:hypothetical protein
LTTLRRGDRAPDFRLPAADREGIVALVEGQIAELPKAEELIALV